MIRAVLFDFGGVLTQSGRKGFIAHTLADMYGVPVADIQIDALHGDLRRGNIDSKAFFAELNRRYGSKRTITPKMFVEKVHATFVAAPGVYELAARLRKHGIRTGILSNVFAINARELREQGRYDGFDPVVLSCDEGYSKPDTEFYQIALKRLGDVRPEEVLFIDDQDKCLPPAQALGMHVIQAKTPEQTVAETETLIKDLNQIEL